MGYSLGRPLDRIRYPVDVRNFGIYLRITLCKILLSGHDKTAQIDVGMTLAYNAAQ